MRDLKNWTPCERPGQCVLNGELVIIQPFDRDTHQDALWQAFGEEQSNELMKYFPNGPYQYADQFGEWLYEMNMSNAYQTMVFIDKASGLVAGMASYMRIDENNGVAEVGAVAHGAAMARGKMATEAHYLMAKHVFDDLGYRRYEWKLNDDNEPSHRSAKRYGFTFEGVFRNHIVAKGKNRDTAWYAMIDREWPQIRKAFETWISDDNFDGNGLQKRRLEDIRGPIEVD